MVSSGSIADGVNNILFSGNFCYNNLQSGIRVSNSSTGTMDKIALRGNYCFSNTDYGLLVSDTNTGEITGVTATGNISYDNGTDYRFDPPDTVNFMNVTSPNQVVKVTANSIIIADGSTWGSGIPVSYENEQVFYENEIVTY